MKIKHTEVMVFSVYSYKTPHVRVVELFSFDATFWSLQFDNISQHVSYSLVRSQWAYRQIHQAEDGQNPHEKTGILISLLCQISFKFHLFVIYLNV